MLCELLILSSLFWTPVVNHVIQKRAAFYIANETMCIVDGDVYRNGDPVPTDDECERCTCRPPGFSCVLRDCDTKPGCKAVRRAGECCPEYVCGCVHNSRLYEDGELIKDLQNNCYTCRCHGSSISCTFADCRFRSDCPPEYIPGECCPRYDHCPLESPTTPPTTTTTVASSTHVIQQEMNFFNFTSQHVQQFTTEGVTVNVEDITTSEFTTPAYTHTVKFTLSGQKISSIHDFDIGKLTTLLPLQTVSYTETTKHVVISQDSELTTVKGGLIVDDFDKTTESYSTYGSKTETESRIKTATGITVLSNLASTDDIYDISSQVPLTNNDSAITILTEDVSDWEEKVQEAKSSTFESDSKEQEAVTNFEDKKFITDEIKQQESSHSKTEVLVSNHTINDKIEGIYNGNISEESPTTEYSKITSNENIQTDNTIDFKPVTEFLSTTTIDDATVTRKVTEEDLESSLFEIFNNANTSTAYDSTATNLEKLDVSSTHTELENAFTTLIEKHLDSSTIISPTSDEEDMLDISSNTTKIIEGVRFTTYDNFDTSTDKAQIITEVYQHGEISSTSSFDEKHSTVSGTSMEQDVYSTSHSTDTFSETSDHDHHHHIETSSEAEVTTDIVEKQAHTSIATSDLNEMFNMHNTTIENETSYDTEEIYDEFNSSSDDLLSTTHSSESNENDIYTTYASSYDHANVFDAEKTMHHEQNTSDSDHSVEIVSSTIRSITEDMTSLTITAVDKDNYSTFPTTKLEEIHDYSSEPSLNDSIHTFVTDKKYYTTIKFEGSDYSAETGITETIGKVELQNVTDFTALSGEEEIAAENEDITTESPLAQTTSEYLTNEEILHLQNVKTATHTEKTIEDKATTGDREISEKVEITDKSVGHDVLPAEYTSVKSIISSDTTLTDVNHMLIHGVFPSTEVTDHKTDNPIDSFEITDAETQYTTSKLINNEIHPSTDDLGYFTTMKPNESTLQPSNTEILLETSANESGIDETITDVEKGEVNLITPVTINTQAPETIATTLETRTTRKIITTTEDDMPNELPAFEPPLANILKQHMLFNRPVSQTEPSVIHKSETKDTSDENQIEKLSLSVEEKDENTHDILDLGESGNRIISLNQEYTIQDSEILSTTGTAEGEKSNDSNETNDNLYFINTQHNDIIQTSTEDKTSTQIAYNVRSTTESEELNFTDNYNEYKNLTANIDIMESENVHSDSNTTSLDETKTNFIYLNAGATIESEKTTASSIHNSETNSILIEELNTLNEENNGGATTRYIPTIGTDTSHPANTAQDNLNENFEQSTNVGLIDEFLNKGFSSSDTNNISKEESSHFDNSSQESDSDFVYEDAESSENTNDGNMIPTSTAAEDLQSHLITFQQNVISSSFSDNNENTTESRPMTSNLDYTSITSDSAKEEYLAALKFSTLYTQKFFTPSHQYQTFASTASEIQNILNSTTNSDIDDLRSKEKDSLQSTVYDSFTEKKQPLGSNHGHLLTVSDDISNAESELGSSLTGTSTNSENLSFLNTHATTLDNLDSSFSTLKISDNVYSEMDETVNQNVPIETSSKSSTEQNGFESDFSESTSNKTENLTQSSDQNYGSRLKEEFAEYGVLGGVYITGKSKYQANTTYKHDNNSNDLIYAKISNEETNQEVKLSTENENMAFYNQSDDFEIENNAESDYSAADSESNTIYTTETANTNGEKTNFDYDATISVNHETLENAPIHVFSTDVSPDGKNLEKTSISESAQESTTTTTHINSDVSNDNTPSGTTLFNEASEISQNDLINPNKSFDDSFSTKIDIVEETGPEKTDDWFKSPYDNLVFANADGKENVSSTKPQVDSSDELSNISTESNSQHGPEKGGEVFEPTFPDIFPINNIKPSDRRDGEDQIISTNMDSSNGNILNGELTSMITMETEDQIHLTSIIPRVSPESNAEHGPEKGGEVFEPTFPDLFPISNSKSNIKNDTWNNEDQQNLSIPSTTKIIDLDKEDITSTSSVSSHTKSDLDASTESNVNFNFVPPLPVLLKSFPKLMQHSNNSKDSLQKKETLNNDHFSNMNLNKNYMSDEGRVQLPQKFPSERNLKSSYDLTGIIDKVFKAPGYDTEIHSSPLKGHSDLKQSLTRLKRDGNSQSSLIQPDIKPNKNIPLVSSDDINLFNNKNILLVEGYGKKQNNFVPVTSSLIIVHSDEENEAKVDSTQKNFGNESKDMFISESLDEIKSTKSENDNTSLDSHKSHPKV